MAEFNVGDKVRRIEDSNYQVFKGGVYTVRGFDDLGHLEFEGLDDFGYSPDSFELVEPAQQPVLEPMSNIDLYTEAELTYIEQLEDEIAKLGDLCSDYAKIIEKKDAEIEVLKQQFSISVDSVGDEKVFKPISDMAIKDWQQALDEGWEFETYYGNKVRVESVSDCSYYPITVAGSGCSYTLEGRWISTLEHHPIDIAKRIK